MVLRNLTLFLSIFLIACGSSQNETKELAVANSMSTALPIGEKLYKKNCKICHGKDGTKGLSGASNLMISSLDKQELKAVVTNGRGSMTAYKSVFTPTEIDSVVDFIYQLRY